MAWREDHTLGDAFKGVVTAMDWMKHVEANIKDSVKGLPGESRESYHWLRWTRLVQWVWGRK